MIYSGFVAYHDALEPFMVPIDSVQPDPENYNNGDIEEIMASIEENGMYRPLTVDATTNTILAGNHTWYACKELGAKDVPVVKVVPTESEGRVGATKIMVSDNGTARLARPDDGQLLLALQKIESHEGSTRGTGYTRADMETLANLASLPLDTSLLESSTQNWPTFSVQLPPETLTAFTEMTDDAEENRERFELLLKMAGWEPPGAD